MKIRKNGTVVNLTESDLRRIVKRVLNEQDDPYGEQLKAAGYVEVDKLDLPDGDYIANGGNLFKIKDSEGNKTGFYGRPSSSTIRGISFSDGNIVISNGEIIEGQENTHYNMSPYRYYKK